MKNLKVKFNKEAFKKLYSCRSENLTIKEIYRLADEVYVLNSKFNGFTKLKNLIWKQSKANMIEIIDNELWILKEVVKYNGGFDEEEYITINMVNNYVPYYKSCLEKGIF